MSTIDISKKNKAEVLAKLFNNSKAQGMGFLHFKPANMSIERAEELLKENTYFDYLEGRVMKIDLSKDELDPWGYDRDIGEGEAERVIDTCLDK